MTDDLATANAELAAARAALAEAVPVWGDNAGTAHERALERVARASARVDALTPPPPSMESEAATEARARARHGRTALEKDLTAEMLSYPAGSDGALRAAEDLARLRRPAPASGEFTWDDFAAVSNHHGSTALEQRRARALAEAAGVPPMESVGMLAGLAELSGANPATLPEIAVSADQAAAFERAWMRLPEAERTQLQASGARRSRGFVDALIAAGSRR